MLFHVDLILCLIRIFIILNSKIQANWFFKVDDRAIYVDFWPFFAYGATI